MMTPEEAFEFINNLFVVDEPQKPLGDVDEYVFIRMYKGMTYSEMEKETSGWSETHLRDVGSKLCTRMRNTFKINVKKTNFKTAIEQLWKQHSKNRPFSQKPLTELTNPAVEDILPPASPSQPQANLIAKNDLINPFIPSTGRIDDPQYFFNRHREINRVFEHLNSNSSVALIGEEGIGKSSLLIEIRRLAESRLSSPRKPIYLDLNQVHDEDDFYCALCHEIGISETRGTTLTRALHSQRLLLSIDNAGRMTWEGFTRNIRNYLRGLAEGSDAPLRLILAAGQPLDQLFQDDNQTSPLHGLFQQEHLKPWDEVTVRAFIENRLETTSVRFTEEEITELVQESAGHPRKLMQLCYPIYKRYMEQVQ